MIKLKKTCFYHVHVGALRKISIEHCLSGFRVKQKLIKTTVDGRPPRYAPRLCTPHAAAQLQPIHVLRVWPAAPSARYE